MYIMVGKTFVQIRKMAHVRLLTHCETASLFGRCKNVAEHQVYIFLSEINEEAHVSG